MKNISLIILLLLQVSLVKAQNITDAVRYSSDNLDGTARFISMGGAFGALGGDLSAIKLNPASSSVFLTNQAALTLNLAAYKNETNYMEGHNSYRNNDLDLSQAGMVFVYNNQNENATVSRLSFGITYDRINNFRNRYKAVGRSNETVSDMFLSFAQGVPLDLFTPRSGEGLSGLYDYLGYANEGFNNNRLQTAYLGYEGYLFDAEDPDDMGNTSYTSNVSGNTFDHFYENYEKGTNGKVSFNGGIAFQDRFYLGLNLNSHIIDFRQNTFINESIPGSSLIQEINFGNYLDTRGSGFSMQIGGIARVGNMVRVGLSYESPTWFRISEETNQILRTYHSEFGEVIVNPRVTNIYPSYSLRTPGRVNASVATIFGVSGLLSFDYSYKDFSNTKFTSSGFGSANREISDRLRAVSTFRAGGEYRIKNFSVRGGFRYEESPYKDNSIGNLRGYSAGLGYNFGGFQIDLAYDWHKRNYNNDLLNTGFSNRAAVKNTMSNYVLTLVFPL
ncbi:MAG TPA: hypothetical protein VK021_00920 [Flavobacteriaceae bacterium]|nr:hypothetical protein [Flavobacteriaceae bacterium]